MFITDVDWRKNTGTTCTVPNVSGFMHDHLLTLSSDSRSGNLLATLEDIALRVMTVVVQESLEIALLASRTGRLLPGA